MGEVDQQIRQASSEQAAGTTVFNVRLGFTPFRTSLTFLKSAYERDSLNIAVESVPHPQFESLQKGRPEVLAEAFEISDFSGLKRAM